jgi:hypothetical protein
MSPQRWYLRSETVPSSSVRPFPGARRRAGAGSPRPRRSSPAARPDPAGDGPGAGGRGLSDGLAAPDPAPPTRPAAGGDRGAGGPAPRPSPPGAHHASASPTAPHRRAFGERDVDQRLHMQAQLLGEAGDQELVLTHPRAPDRARAPPAARRFWFPCGSACPSPRRSPPSPLGPPLSISASTICSTNVLLPGGKRRSARSRPASGSYGPDRSGSVVGPPGEGAGGPRRCSRGAPNRVGPDLELRGSPLGRERDPRAPRRLGG